MVCFTLKILLNQGAERFHTTLNFRKVWAVVKCWKLHPEFSFDSTSCLQLGWVSYDNEAGKGLPATWTNSKLMNKTNADWFFFLSCSICHLFHLSHKTFFAGFDICGWLSLFLLSEAFHTWLLVNMSSLDVCFLWSDSSQALLISMWKL